MRIALIALGGLALLILAVISGPPSWRPDVKKYEQVADPGGRQIIRETDSHGETITYEVVEQRAPVLLKRRIADTGLPYSGSWTFELKPDGSGPMVRITEDADVYNPFFRFVSHFIIGYTR